MKGRLLDIGLITAWSVVFLIVAMVHPGLANMLIAWFGLVGLGWYNTLIRRNPTDDSLRPAWQRTSSPSASAAATEDI